MGGGAGVVDVCAGYGEGILPAEERDMLKMIFLVIFFCETLNLAGPGFVRLVLGDGA